MLPVIYIFGGIAVLSILIVLTILSYLVYSGILHNVQVGAGRPPIGQFVGVYKFGRGHYKESCHIFTEAVSIAPNLKTFGVYYDDPNKVATDKLRWGAGCILSVDDEVPDPELVKVFQQNNFKQFTFPRVENAVTSSFPFRTQLSVLLAVWKVYPAAWVYVQERKLCAYPWLEIYSGFDICFMAPLSRQNEFMIPDAVQAEEQDRIDAAKASSVPSDGDQDDELEE